MRACMSGDTSIRVSIMGGASSLEMTMATACVKSMSIPWRGSGRSCGVGCARIGAFPKRNSQIPSDFVVKSQATDVIDLILQLIRHQNGVHRSCRNRTSRGVVLSTSEVQWATTKFDGVWIVGVPLSMVRIVGGMILMRIGFSLFAPSSPGASRTGGADGSARAEADVAFVPLAMPIMFGPGAIATILGMVSLVKHAAFEVVSALA